MIALPPDFARHAATIVETAHSIEGWLIEREMRFLALLAACPTAEGSILEYGSYKGKSTSVLALANRLGDRSPFTTVDICDSGVLRDNLRRAGVEREVAVHIQSSLDFVKAWNQPIRLFWHDGDNRYETVRQDVANVLPHLVDRAIVAFHDVLNESGDRVQVYLESVLSSPHFGACGLCGSIGWAQFHRDPTTTQCHEPAKRKLKTRLARVAPFQGVDQSGSRALRKLVYRLLRFQVPHREVEPIKWLGRVA